jgi:transcriptional regulator with XRE-family HTH domain
MPTRKAVDGSPDPIDVAVGVRIRTRRKWLSISQTDLARALGITFQQVQKYEKGTNRMAASTLVRAARALDTSVGALIGEEKRGPSDDLLGVPHAARLLTAWRRLTAVRQAAFLHAISAAGDPEAGEEV